MSIPALRRALTLAPVLLVTVAGHAAAQARAAACAPVPPARGPVFVYGREGGNIRPLSVSVFADGTVRTGDSTAVPPRADSAAIAAVARLARRSPFWTLPANTTHRPTKNPDEARLSIAVHLTCGTHHSVYPFDAAPKSFRAVLERLTSLTGVTP